MARYKPYDYDQMMMVSIALAEQLVPGTLEYAIHHIIEERADASFFDERYNNDETGSLAIDPKVYSKLFFSVTPAALHHQDHLSVPAKKISCLWH